MIFGETQDRALTESSLLYVAAGVPIKLLYQGEGHVVTVEMKNGEVYRGQLAEAEETMNCQLKDGE